MDDMAFTWHPKFTDAIMKINNPNERLEAFEAIARYGSYGEEQEPSSFACSIIYTFAKDDIDNSHSKRAGGSKGGSKLASNEASKLASKLPNKLASEDKTTSEQASLEAKHTYIQTNKQTNKQERESKERKRKAFSPPSRADVEAFVCDANITLNIDRFMDYYSAQGWKLSNGNAMKDWKAAARNWSRRDDEEEATIYDKF